MQALTLKNIQFTCINRYSVLQLWLELDINIMHDTMYFPFRSYGKFTAFTLKLIWPDYVVTDCRITPNRPCVFAIIELDINVHMVVVSDDSSTAEIRRLLSAVLRLSSDYQYPRSKTRIASHYLFKDQPEQDDFSTTVSNSLQKSERKKIFHIWESHDVGEIQTIGHRNCCILRRGLDLWHDISKWGFLP